MLAPPSADSLTRQEHEKYEAYMPVKVTQLLLSRSTTQNKKLFQVEKAVCATDCALTG